MEVAPHFTHHFLIATPSMSDTNFTDTVVYLCEHGASGAMGIVINRPSPLNFERLLSRMDLDFSESDLAHRTVLKGGPVHSNRGFVLHRHTNGSRFSSTMQINQEMALTTSRDILEALHQGALSDDLLITMGYASWGPGQLEQEIASTSDWLLVPADSRIIFDTPLAQRYKAAVGLLGIDISQLLPSHNSWGHR